MADKAEFLAEHTFSEQGLDTWQRVYETLTQDPRFETHRTAKLLAMLVETLEKQELIDASVIDDILIDVVR